MATVPAVGIGSPHWIVWQYLPGNPQWFSGTRNHHWAPGNPLLATSGSSLNYHWEEGQGLGPGPKWVLKVFGTTIGSGWIGSPNFLPFPFFQGGAISQPLGSPGKVWGPPVGGPRAEGLENPQKGVGVNGPQEGPRNWFNGPIPGFGGAKTLFPWALNGGGPWVGLETQPTGPQFPGTGQLPGKNPGCGGGPIVGRPWGLTQGPPNWLAPGDTTGFTPFFPRWVQGGQFPPQG